jgi:hypothetical protein
LPHKTLGYVNLVWRCPNCNQLNPGPEKTCGTCGSPQPENVEFENPPQQEISTDESMAKEVRKGADIHCPYCHTRNEGDATVCKQCGGDLTGAKQRESGRIVGSPELAQAGEVTCPACGTINPASNLKCSSCGGSLAKQAPKAPINTQIPSKVPSKMGKGKIFGIVAAILVLGAICISAISFLTRTSEVNGTVTGLSWDRQIAIEQIQPVSHQDWFDNIPAGAQVNTCKQELYTVSDQPSGNYQEVCGTPYTVDTGTGIGQVVQDCQYEIYADYCEYTVQEWTVVDVAEASGQDLNPYWPVLNLSNEQRQGDTTESYTVSFDSTEGALDYKTSNVTEFQQFSLGSQWVLEVSTLGGISSYAPK